MKNIFKSATFFFFAALLGNTASADTIVTPILDVTPEYPASANRRDTKGFVTLQFDIADNGKARNITVIEAFPEKAFNGAAMTALRRSSFEVVDAAGNNTEAYNIQRVYRFENSQLDSREVSMN